MDMQNAKNLTIPEGAVKTIHDKDNRLLWGAVGYDTKYAGDTFQQTYSGKNFFNGGTWRQIRTDGGTPAPVAGESIIVDSGTNFVEFSVPTTYRGAESDYIPVTAGQTITLSFNAVKICNRMWISQYDSSKNRLSTLNPDSKIVATTTVTTTDNGYIRVAFGNTSGGENFEFDNIQLELGQTVTSYEPFVGSTSTQIAPAPNPEFPQDIQVVTGEQTVEIGDGNTSQSFTVNLQSKNLFDKDTVTLDYRLDGSGQPYANAGYCVSDYFEIKPSTTYTYSFSGLLATSNSAICYYDADKTFISRTTPLTSSSTDTAQVTSPANAYYARIADFSNRRDTMQFEVGSTASTYTSYWRYELCKIDTYQDYIYKSGSDWYVHKEINKVTLNGSESWGGSNSKYNYSSADIVAQPLTQNAPIVAVSNYLTASNYWAISNNLADNIVSGYYNGGQIRTRVTSFATVTDWKTWLSNHNMVVYYVLATSANIKITDATLISQLDAIHQWLTRYGYNAIVSGNLPIIIDRTAL